MNTPSKEDLDNLFGPMFEEYYEQKSSDTPIYSAAQPTQVHEDSSSTSSIIIDTHEAPPVVITSDEQTSPISLTEAWYRIFTKGRKTKPNPTKPSTKRKKCEKDKVKINKSQSQSQTREVKD
ncbi:hypothetical protein Tco_0226172 [Tanacetum coccineum]